MSRPPHQYIDRASGQLRTERLYQDEVVMFFYDRVREQMPAVFTWLTSRQSTRLLGYLNYDQPWSAGRGRRFLEEQSVDLGECLDDPHRFRTARDVFERKIRYWDCRPMSYEPYAIVSPADARALIGTFVENATVYLKEKFFGYEELLGNRPAWLDAFHRGDYAIFRLTPEKYHYNHTPVAGRVLDVYEIDGVYHSCNPGAAMSVAAPYSKNRRVVTVIDTDVPGGTQVGLVAMIEVVALMIGEIVQCYSESRYDHPQDVVPGMFVERGCPKSLFRPGSSTTVLVFEPGRVKFSPDLVANQQHPQAQSRYTLDFARTLVETDVRVRSPVAYTRQRAPRRRRGQELIHVE
ncbi:MAG TPA: phosphatidylserine decarboxylase [Gammaproteobacteria bacterium]|nr:phosphatidylserine decarboxylase [Gammaproteobacteria bacterium]